MTILICSGSKRGDVILDTLFVLIIVLAFATIGFFIYPSFQEVQDDLGATESPNDNAKNTMDTFMDTYPGTLDGIVAFFMVITMLFVIISSYLLDTSPVFFVVSIILFIATIVVAIVMSNSFVEVMQDEAFATAVPVFPITTMFVQYLAHILFVMIFVVAIVIYAKSR